MALVCLISSKVDTLKQDIISGRLNPEELAKMSSAQRSEYLSKYVGNWEAKLVNANFESKLLLKNQQAGLVTWVKQLINVKPEVKRDLLSKISKLDGALDPENKSLFMSDLVETKLGVKVSADEFKTITDLAKKVQDTSLSNNGSYESRMAWGRSKVDLADYVNALKDTSNKITMKGLASDPSDILIKSGGFVKSLKASLDNSAIFRQGWKTMMTNPRQWYPNALGTFKTIWKELGGKNTMREVNADIISRPTYKVMQKAGLAIGNIEEAYPVGIMGSKKLGMLGRTYKASESAFTGFVQKTRADVFDEYLKIAESGGIDINNEEQLKAIGKVVNSLTGRGGAARAGKTSQVVNSLFFSPKFLISNLNTLTAHAFNKEMTPFARKMAAKNLVKIIAGTTGILAIANMVSPGSVDADPRSADFGKIKVGDTRFDVTGGMGSILTLAARLLPSPGDEGWNQYTKSSTTGKITNLNSGDNFQQNLTDVLTNFVTNKLSPIAGVGNQIIFTKKTNSGDPLSIVSIARDLFAPMPITNAVESFKNPNSAPVLVTMLADGLGIGANTYSAQKGTWGKSSSNEIKGFKAKVGDKEFTKASNIYDTAYNTWISQIRNSDAWKNKSTSEQTAIISKEKNNLQDEIFKQYNYKYKLPKHTKTDTSLLKTLNNLSNK